MSTLLNHFLKCFFFYDKPVVEVKWNDKKGMKTKVIYNSQFKRFKTMDDLIRYLDIPVYQKYIIKYKTTMINPWDRVSIYKDFEVVNGEKRIQIKMKKLYGL
jgi:hypothetical protein